MKGLTDDKNIRFGVEEKLPHKDGMLLINGIAFKKDNTINLSMKVPEASIFVSPDLVLAPLAMIEMLAQLCGAQYIYDNGFKDGQLCGYLVGIDNVIFSKPVYAGDMVKLIAWNVLEMKEIQRVKGEVYKEDIKVGQCELTLFKMDEWVDFPTKTENAEKFEQQIHNITKFWDHDKDAVGQGILNNLRGIEIKLNQAVEASFSFDSEFIGFSGHFPGYPVLPAVITVYVGWLMAEICSNTEQILYSVRRAKFMEPIFPNDTVNITVTHIINDCNTDSMNEDHQLDVYSVVMSRNGKKVATYRLGTKPRAKRVQI